MIGEDTAEEDIPGAFNAAPVWGRISVVAAGPIFNFILAFILSVIIVGFMGYDPAEVMEVQKGSPAAEAGLQKGDIITAIDGKKVGNIYDYMNRMKEFSPGQIISVDVLREGKSQIFIINL